MPDPAVADVSPLPAAGPGKGATGAVYTIGELAREFDLTTRAIRFYEDCGLLTPQRRGRNRVYTARDRTRLKLTLRGKRLGLTLAEVKDLVDMYESPRDTVPQLTRFLEVLAGHRAQLEQQLADLHVTLDEVRSHEKEARRLLKAGGGERAPR
ncbi:MAG: MerR family DNA-binding transcriptional regulator [Ideonella sp.]|nr:MerR family DNA-binding transcriptional regulator [Ideonella sp.]